MITCIAHWLVVVFRRVRSQVQHMADLTSRSRVLMSTRFTLELPDTLTLEKALSSLSAAASRIFLCCADKAGHMTRAKFLSALAAVVAKGEGGAMAPALKPQSTEPSTGEESPNTAASTVDITETLQPQRLSSLGDLQLSEEDAAPLAPSPRCWTCNVCQSEQPYPEVPLAVHSYPRVDFGCILAS